MTEEDIEGFCGKLEDVSLVVVDELCTALEREYACGGIDDAGADRLNEALIRGAAERARRQRGTTA